MFSAAWLLWDRHSQLSAVKQRLNIVPHRIEWSSISVQSVKLDKDTVTVAVSGAPDGGTVVAAAYAGGKMLTSGTANLNGGSTYQVRLNTAGADSVSVFLLDGNQKPLCQKYSEKLN